MAFFKFTALRLGFVLVFFVICYWMGLGAIMSAVIAAVLAWCVTYLFFRAMRDAASASLQRRFREDTPPARTVAELGDAEAEDHYDPNSPVNADRRNRG
ncbi:DUF4229 domain-containing protein [Arthrobacter sp. H5]|uniref:DUF4229 domain-containing protein n=1 Tax=Arthrobacter sp. H5 TaxID=1267973 RepID=UPI00047F6271|nr:DUF4229 domain-containing protein [Arthrobacter sp. H5]